MVRASGMILSTSPWHSTPPSGSFPTHGRRALCDGATPTAAARPGPPIRRARLFRNGNTDSSQQLPALPFLQEEYGDRIMAVGIPKISRIWVHCVAESHISRQTINAWSTKILLGLIFGPWSGGASLSTRRPPARRQRALRCRLRAIESFLYMMLSLTRQIPPCP